MTMNMKIDTETRGNSDVSTIVRQFLSWLLKKKMFTSMKGTTSLDRFSLEVAPVGRDFKNLSSLPLIFMGF